MVKLNWDRADRYERDPGSVVEVPDSRERWTPPDERKRKEAERAERNRELRRKSEEYDHQLIVDRLMRDIRREEDSGGLLSGWDRLILRNHKEP
jgi:hypothetical protein